MKRIRPAALLAAALCLLLAACAKKTPPVDPPPAPDPGPSEPAPAPPESGELTLGVLNLEFVTEGRDIDALRLLQKELPGALIDALSAQECDVSAVNVTFGTSADATVQAIAGGDVSVGFVPSATFFDHERALRAAAVESGRGPDQDASVAVVPAGDDVLGGERFTAALCAALGTVREALVHYTGEEGGGRFTADDDLLENLRRYHDTGSLVLLTRSVTADGGRELTLAGLGTRLPGGAWGMTHIEVRDGETTVQTIEMSESQQDDPYGGILGGETFCPALEELFALRDVNFDGRADLDVYGWLPASNTVPHFFWLWDAAEGRFVYAFSLQGPVVDEAAQELRAEYRAGPREYRTDHYRFVDGVLTLVETETETV